MDTTPPVLSSSDKTFTTTVGTPLTLETVTASDNKDGSVTVNQTGNVDFNTAGTYKITYTAKDSAGNTASTTHTYVVNAVAPVNTPPTANNDTANTAHNTPATIDVLGNDNDANGDPLTITNVNGTNWTWAIESNKIKFTPTNGFSWTATATYTISDGNGGTDTASVSVEVAISQPTISMSDQEINDRWWLNPTDLPAPTTTNVNSWAKYSIEWNPNPSMITINENTWVITWNWNLLSWHQTYTIKLKVINLDWWTQTTTFKLTVKDN